MKRMEINKCMGCMSEFRGYPCPSCGYAPGKQQGQEFALPQETILAGKYLVGRVLGQGGFGITYIGWDIALERKVAIKEYYPSGQVSRAPGTKNLTWYTSDSARQARQDGMQLFLKEARKMAKVDRIPNVVRILDLFQENETAYIVMDFVEGQTLKSLLQKNGPMGWEQAKGIFLPAIRAMELVHGAGLVHRDLSPDNLMLTSEGSVMILDLGAAKDLNINSGASSMQVAKGGFSPMEQYTQRGGSGSWTDVYAMAATIYYTLTGKLPPVATDRIMEDTIRWDYPGLLSLPAPALEALKQAMAVLPKQRTQTMQALEKGLFAEVPKPEPPKPEPKPEPRPEPKPEPKPEPPKPEPKPKKPLPKWLIPAVAAVVLVAGIGIWAKVIKPANDYKAAPSLMDDVVYETATEAYEDYEDSTQKADKAATNADDIPDEMASADGKYQIAFVTDGGPLKDRFNQGIFDGVKLYAANAAKSYKYYQPVGGDWPNEDDCYDAMKLAADNGAEVIVCTGIYSGLALERAAKEFTNVKFVFIDGWALGMTNVAGICFHEEQCGYLAGYAAVMDGYTKLGFCGAGDGDNFVINRYGYGFVQGADAAAAKLGVKVDMNYSWLYGTFYQGSDELQDMAAGWYSTGTEVIFVCGGSMFQSIAAAASAEDGAVIGAGVDQSFVSPAVITSAVMETGEAAQLALKAAESDDTWKAFVGDGSTAIVLGAAEGAVGLPTATWSLENWTVDQYKSLLADIADGKVNIDGASASEPSSTANVTMNIVK